jgi:hypothetical protein
LGVNDNFFGDNGGGWTALISTSEESVEHPLPPDSGQSRILNALIRTGTTIQLPKGVLHLYGMATGGGAPSTLFKSGQYAHVVNADGHVSAALAYGAEENNGFTTRTSYQSIAGASIIGSWRSFDAFHGSNSEVGASDASVRFSVRAKSLVVVIGLASSQQEFSLVGIPLETDAVKSGEGAIIAHAYLEPGTYTVVGRSRASAAGQDARHMADLIEVFVFGLT